MTFPGSHRIASLVISVALMAIYGAFSLPDRSKDVIVEVAGNVSMVAFADLDGNGLKDLIALTSPGEDDSSTLGDIRACVGLEVFFQIQNGNFESTSVPHEITEGLFLLDVGNFTDSAGKELVSIRNNAIVFLDFDAERTVSVHQVPVIEKPLFHAAAHQAPHWLDCSADCDRNGYDDILFPTSEGYAVFLNNEDGIVEEPFSLSRSPSFSIQYSENSFFSLMTITGKLHTLSKQAANPVFITLSEGKLLAYQYGADPAGFLWMQSARDDFGAFSSEMKDGKIEYAGIVFNENDRSGETYFVRSVREGHPGLLAALKTTHTIFVFRTFGEQQKIETPPLQRVVTNGIAAAPVFSDLDADGYADLIFIYVKTSILSKLLEMFLDRIVVTCQAHRFEPREKRFSFKPDWSADIPIPTRNARLVGTEGLILFNGDYSGDGRPDLVVFDHDRLLIKRGERDEGFFTTDEIAFHDRPFYQIGPPLPGPVFSEDVDDDGIPEIITHGGSIVRIVYVR